MTYRSNGNGSRCAGGLTGPVDTVELTAVGGGSTWPGISRTTSNAKHAIFMVDPPSNGPAD